MRDFLTIKDRELAEFAEIFKNGVGELRSMMNLTVAQDDELGAIVKDFKEILAEIDAARAHQKGLTGKKNKTQKQLKQLIRRLATTARANENVKESELAKLGLKVHDRTRTAAAAPETAPHIIVEIQTHRRHTIKVFDFADSTSRAKPKGTSGAEIWVYVGAETNDLSEKNMRYLGLATRGTMAFTHEPEDAGKQAFYLARWINKQGMRGGWSNPASATVAV